MKICNTLLLVALVLNITSSLRAVPTGGQSGHGTYGPPPPTLDRIMYSNADGIFDTNPSGDGFATYNWQNHGYSDKLVFAGQINLTANGHTMLADVFEATDGTNRWYLAFGQDHIGADGNNRWVFPLWYSFTSPTTGFSRWNTQYGTNRKRLLP